MSVRFQCCVLLWLNEVCIELCGVLLYIIIVLMKEGSEEYWERVTSDGLLVICMLKECSQMYQRCSDVGVGCVARLLQLCVGEVNIHMYAITMEIYLLVCMCRLAEEVYFHGVYNCSRGEGSGRVEMMQQLCLHASVLVFIQLICPDDRLMCNDASCRTHESDVQWGGCSFTMLRT